MPVDLPYPYVLALAAIAFACGYVFRWSCQRDRARLAYRPPCACERLRALAEVYTRAGAAGRQHVRGGGESTVSQ